MSRGLQIQRYQEFFQRRRDPQKCGACHVICTSRFTIAAPESALIEVQPAPCLPRNLHVKVHGSSAQSAVAVTKPATEGAQSAVPATNLRIKIHIAQPCQGGSQRPGAALCEGIFYDDF